MGSSSDRRCGADALKDGGRPEEGNEAPRDKEEQDIEAGDNLPYVIKTSDVMGR